MNKAWYFTVILVFIVIVFSVNFIKYQIFLKKHQFCPHCQNKTKRKWKSKYLDPKNERITIGNMRVLAGTVVKKWEMIYCDRCGYEIKVLGNTTEDSSFS